MTSDLPSRRTQLGRDDALPGLAEAGYGAVGEHHSDGATAQRWWDAEAADYLAEHGADLGAADFVWGPEGLREADAGLLDTAPGERVLEVGAGAGQCARWLVSQGVDAVATDISGSMLRAGIEANHATGTAVPLAQADAQRLPFAAETFDAVFTSYGVLPFVADAARVHAEVARVLRPGGRWVFSVTHPIRWAFPDDPGPGGLTATRSYFDTVPYRELDDDGATIYVEHHRTVGDHVRDVVGAGLVVRDLVEPRWQHGRPTWGGWSELRDRHLPGTLVVVSVKPLA